MWTSILAILKIVGSALGLIERNKDEVASENKVIAVDNAQSAKVNSDVAQVINDSSPDVNLKLLRGGKS